MADFSTQATELSSPRGEGSVPVAATSVQQPLATGGMSIVSTIADVFAKGLTETRKEDALKRQNMIVQGYIGEVTRVNDAIASGLDPTIARIRTNSIFNKYAAGYGEYIGEFEKAGKALRGFTEMGEAEDVIKTEKARQESNKTLAINRGFSFYKGMSKEAEDAQIESALTSVRVEAQLIAQYKASAEIRAQGGYNATTQALDDKRQAFDSINMVAKTNITSFQALAKDLGEQARSGKMSKEDAELRLGERYSNIEGAIASAARLNPELASGFTKVFSDIHTLGLKLLDPANEVKALQDQLQKRIVQSKLLVTEDKEVLAGVVSSALFRDSPAVVLDLNQASQKALVILGKTPGKTSEYIPQVVGNPEIETPVIKGLKQGLKDIQSGNVSDKKIAIDQSSNSINNLLTQAGDVMDKKGASPTQLKAIAEFVSSTEYVTAVQQGKISPQAAGAAGKAFQIVYQPVIVDGLQERLGKELPRGLAAGGGASLVKGKKPTTLGETVDIKFTGSGIVFESKVKAGMVPSEIRAANVEVESLRSSQAAITQLIHIAAHLEGSTDYSKYWEKNKHNWIPSVFPDPVKLKPGAVVDGYQYNGGAYNDRASWTKQ